MPPKGQQQTGKGNYSITIGWEDIIKGMSVSDRSGDAGFSPKTQGLNPFFNKGSINMTPAQSAISGSNGSYFMVSTCDKIVSTGGTFSIFKWGIDSNGFMYGLTSSGWGNDTGQDSTNTYANYYSDLIAFNNKIYSSSHNATTGDNVAQWNEDGSLASANWFYTNFSSEYLQLEIPHPMIVYNNFLYIADGQYLHKYDGASGYTPKVLTISPDYTIVGLAIDPSSGYLMVAISESFAQGASGINKIGLYDGTNPTQFVKIMNVSEQITSLVSLGGYVYIFYGNSLGIFNGNGINFLRSTSGNIAKAQTAAIDNILFYLDNSQNIIAYGEVIGGQQKIFSDIFSGPISPSILSIYEMPNKVLGYNRMVTTGVYGNSSFPLYANPSYLNGELRNFYSNNYYFPRPVYIRAMYFIMDSIIADLGQVVCTFLDSNGNSLQGITLTNTMTELTNYIDLGSFRTLSLQMLLSISTAATIRRIVILYDIAE